MNWDKIWNVIEWAAWIAFAVISLVGCVFVFIETWKYAIN